MSENKVEIALNINGKFTQASVDANLRFADFLHEKAGLTGTRVCCGMGICKACTFACKDTKDGEQIKLQACVTPAASMNGKHVTTVEGLVEDGQLSALQEAFLKHFSFQCGYCTSGFLMAATVLMAKLKRKPIRLNQLDETIDKAIGDNICRCTGYVKYHAAVREVIKSTPGLIVD